MSNKKAVGFACDHAAYEMKEFLVGYMSAKGYEVIDFGCHSEERCDYADFAHPLASAVEDGSVAFGIALCGSGEGMAMTLNKHRGIRAGLAWRREIAELIKQHNDANILVLPARFISNDEAVELVAAYLAAEFEGGRHEQRIAKMQL
ncbi:MAG: RpiB/LacA/LacB family sugar-phosphate isomerase [Alistipes sp.]|jgi:ribose 5-phosphate isomerase B|nr:RpiB/LacA/LacB family sugar-phosphate isomerase [Alistipes sp.]